MPSIVPAAAAALLLLAGSIAPAAETPTPAGHAPHSDHPCGPYKQLVRALLERFDERPVASGVDGQGRAVEVLASPDGETWTILVRDPSSGIACMASAGRGWGMRRFALAGRVS